MRELTQERLKELLSYNPDTGVFTWREGRNRKLKGKRAGYVVSKGYRQIMIHGAAYREHRLAFLYVEGVFPPDQVDHINRIGGDNRWVNIRHATNSINGHNKSNNTDFPGVSWNKAQEKWVAYATVNRKRISLGTFKTHLAACYSRFNFNKTIGDLS